MTATVDLGGPFKIETKPYTIAAQVELAEAEEMASKPEALETKPAVAAEVAPEAPGAKPVSETSQAEGMKAANWIVLSALIGLGVAAAGFAVFKKSA